MARTNIQKSKGRMSNKCAKILVEFANAEALFDGLTILETKFRKVFRLQKFLPPNWLTGERKNLGKAQRQLVEFLEEHERDRNLANSKILPNYDFDYHMLCQSKDSVDAQDYGEPDRLACFKSGGEIYFEAVIAFCIHHYLKDEYRKPISKCEYKGCGLFSVAERNTKRFCSQKHKVYQSRANRDPKSHGKKVM